MTMSEKASRTGWKSRFPDEDIYLESDRGILYQGHVLDVLRRLPDESVDLIITSPPYWSLRSYPGTETVWGGDPDCEHEWGDTLVYKERGSTRGKTAQTGTHRRGVQGTESIRGQFCRKCGAWHGQLGLEPTLGMYIDHLLEITAELKRVLKRTGVMFWNMGDSYGGSNRGSHDYRDRDGLRMRPRTQYTGQQPCKDKFIPPKCLTLQNSRLAIRMVDEQGWILRNRAIWAKKVLVVKEGTTIGNAMPQSVTDRFANTYELVFMFTKNNKPAFYYNIKTGMMADKRPRRQNWKVGRDYNIIDGGVVKYWKSLHYFFDLDAVRIQYRTGEWDKMLPIGDVKHAEGNINPTYSGNQPPSHPVGANPGEVWQINLEPLKESHFAPFPTKLVTMILKSACPQWTCKKCGKPRVRITRVEYNIDNPQPKGNERKARENLDTNFDSMRFAHGYSKRYTVGWTDCGCNAGWEAGIVLDPFMGSGTTALVAEKLGRNWIGIELNPSYCEIARKRLGPFLSQKRLEVT